MCTWVCDQIFCEIEQPLDNWTSTFLDDIQKEQHEYLTFPNLKKFLV